MDKLVPGTLTNDLSKQIIPWNTDK